MSAYFVTGIGTEAGKTFVTCTLTRQLRKKDRLAYAYKPIISGMDTEEVSDSTLLLEAMEKPVNDETLHNISPWQFNAPLSPHLAAEKDNKHIDEQAVLEWCREKIAIHKNDITLFEGAGGLMVPINWQCTLLDVIKQLNISTVLVSSSYLGAINHTLLSLEALQSRDIDASAIVISQAPEEHCAGLEDTARSIRALTNDTIPLHSIPRITHNDMSALPDLTGIIR